MSGLKVMVETAFPDHWKVLKLAELLKVDEVHALGFVTVLWCRVMENDLLTGEMKKWSDSYIAHQAKWKGPADVFVGALVESELVIGGPGSRAIYSWEDHQGNLVKKRADDAERKRRYLAKLKGEAPAPPATPPAQKPAKKAEKSLAKETAQAEALAATREIVDLWNHGRESNAWIAVTPKRVAKVAARLKDFTLEQLRTAIANIKESEFHMGGSPTGWRCPGPEWVFNTREKCEEWVAKVAAPVPKTATSSTATLGDLSDAIKKKFGGGV
jgi:hypothetical protein